MSSIASIASPPSIDVGDLDQIVRAVGFRWEALRGAELFVTGGTGTLGAWILESFHYANRKLNLEACVTVLSRNPARFFSRMPHLLVPGLRVMTGDIRDFKMLLPTRPHYIIHAAAESSSDLAERDPKEMRDVIERGTDHLIDTATRLAWPLISMLYVSSRAAEDAPFTGYGGGKRIAESAVRRFGIQRKLKTSAVRYWALIGPHVPLDSHFAAGNFIRDVLSGREPILIGDGTAIRCWLYMADAVIALWEQLLDPSPLSAQPVEAYGLEALSIGKLAQLISDIHFHQRPDPYYPYTSEAIRKTLSYYHA